MFDGYSRTVSEGKYKTKYGKGHKILGPKQMLQRLPKALAQVTAGNTCENLVNEIKQIMYFCIKKKKLLKEYTTISWIK